MLAIEAERKVSSEVLCRIMGDSSPIMTESLIIQEPPVCWVSGESLQTAAHFARSTDRNKDEPFPIIQKWSQNLYNSLHTQTLWPGKLKHKHASLCSELSKMTETIFGDIFWQVYF